jgi:hypothetical protein
MLPQDTFRGQSHSLLIQRVLFLTSSCNYIGAIIIGILPPLWSSGQNSRLQVQRSRVRFPALPDFLRSSGSGTGSTQPREYN